jgi:His-Xaa-Ser system protein HxsD
MHSFNIKSDQKADFKIDTEIYSAEIVGKISYWLGKQYIVSEEKDGKDYSFTIEKKNGFAINDWSKVKDEISRMCTDYRMREIIHQETKDVRTILYLKAFANIREIMEDTDE